MKRNDKDNDRNPFEGKRVVFVRNEAEAIWKLWEKAVCARVRVR